MQDPKQYILKILEIINYEGDKEKFVKDFLSICIKEAINGLFKELTDEKQDELNRRLSLVSQDKIESVLLEYFSKEKFDSAVKEATEKVFEDYFNTVIPTLSEEQSGKLEEFLSSQSQAAV